MTVVEFSNLQCELATQKSYFDLDYTLFFRPPLGGLFIHSNSVKIKCIIKEDKHNTVYEVNKT